MFSEKPHMNIASQVLGAVVCFVLFQIFINSLRTKQAYSETNYAITQMQQRHFELQLKKQQAASKASQEKTN